MRCHMLEMELKRERARLREAEGRRRSSRRNCDRRSTSRRHRSRSPPGRHHTLPHAEQRVTSQAEQQEEQHAEHRPERRAKRPAEHRDDAGRYERSRSPSFSKKDLVDIILQLRGGLTSQPPAQPAQQPLQKIDHKNILPGFDPSTKNQRMDIWLKKVNECAAVYGWDERTTTHFAMQKLQGLAKTWYESLNTILFSWQEWQAKLLDAFPCDQNYGQILEDMLKRKSKFNEPIEVYYYEKLSLVNQCDIVGKRAADCIIHGITDRTLRSGALALRCTHPDQLLPFLMSYKESSQISSDRYHVRNRTMGNTFVGGNSTAQPKPGLKPGQQSGCYNCKEPGHSYLYCTKPIIKCTKCNRIGHTAEKCFTKNSVPGDKLTSSNTTVPKVMKINLVDSDVTSRPSSKYFKDVVVQGRTLTAFIDFGSQLTLIRESTVKELGISHDHIPTLMKGFGNGLTMSLGSLTLDLSVDGVGATVSFRAVDDELLDRPILVGQSYTEQAHITVYKDANKLQFFNITNEFTCVDVVEDDESLLRYHTFSVVQLHGAASVRVRTKTAFDGDVLVKQSIAGRPNETYIVSGGLYHSVKGSIYVLVMPCANSCQILPNVVFCRAERVHMVKQVAQVPTDTGVETEFDVKQVRIGDGVSSDDRDKLLDLLKKYRHCFASSLASLGCTNAAEMSIELNSQRPVVYRPYRLSHHEREKVRSMVGEMLEAGIVRESVSDYASPILLVRKKDGSLRLCVDYRMLNSVTVKERYPMPIIEEEIARLAGQSWFITLDLASGYYQVPISEHSKHFTSFVTPDGQYEFNRMPFGLANAPAVFQRMINSILGSARFGKATAYIDDILIYGQSPAECLERLEDVLKAVESANLTLLLICRNVTFCVRRLIIWGLAGYFRKFVRDFAQISLPLSKLLKKDSIWELGDSQEEAFENLKARLVERPVLSIYDPAAETELHTDARPYRIIKDLGMDRYTVAPVPGLSCTENRRPTTVAADRIKPWISIAALEVNDDDSDSNSNSDDDDDNIRD
ncbi:uncharacterized protein LOC134805417 [Cydia splendana]|uniref:uncharacterized protein LOC134805417 n=1 Tax=Cydia splendana TaxID=1100963 RepID=UPI00300CCC4C